MTYVVHLISGTEVLMNIIMWHMLTSLSLLSTSKSGTHSHYCTKEG